MNFQLGTGYVPAYEIYVNLSDRDILNLCQTNQANNTICNDPGLWKYLLKKRYGLTSANSGISDANCKSEYIRMITDPRDKFVEAWKGYIDFEYMIVPPGSNIHFYNCTLKCNMKLITPMQGGPFASLTSRGTKIDCIQASVVGDPIMWQSYDSLGNYDHNARFYQ